MTDVVKNTLIWGRNAVFEHLRADNDIEQVLLADSVNRSSFGKILKMLSDKNIVFKYVPRDRLDYMVPDVKHQGIVATVPAYQYSELSDLFIRAQNRNEKPFFILLDKIEDPHNLGAILRSADAAGVHGIIIPKRRSVGLTESVAKVSAGAVEYVPVVRVNNLAQTLENLKGKGLWVVGADMNATHLYDSIDLNLPLVVVIGNEHRGISTLIRKKCDFLIKIPLKGNIESLNASVAAALIMYQVEAKRR